MTEEKDIQKILQGGGIGVLPTDTLYGLVGSAFLPETVERIYKTKNRDSKKPLIVLLSSPSELSRFGLEVSEAWEKNHELLSGIWPGKVSVLFPCKDEAFAYLHRGSKEIAFRVPDVPELQEFLDEVGPLVAPSANPEGLPLAQTISEAKEYFGETVDFYEDGGKLTSEPSTLIRFTSTGMEVLRKGARQF